MESFSFTRPPGVDDRGFDMVMLCQSIENIILDVLESYGYQRAAPPIIEYIDLYHRDRIGDRMYGELIVANLGEYALFPGVRPELGRPVETDQIALRPDLTAPTVRMFVTENLKKRTARLPARISYSGRVFRNSKPSPFANREFHQTGMELIGSDSFHADLEALAVVADCCLRLDLKSWTLRLSHAGLAREAVKNCGVANAQLDAALASLSRMVRGVEIFQSASKAGCMALDNEISELKERYELFVRFGLIKAASWPKELSPKVECPIDKRAESASGLLREMIFSHWKNFLGLHSSVIAKLMRLVEDDLNGNGIANVAVCSVEDIADKLVKLSESLYSLKRIRPKTCVIPIKGIGYYTGVSFQVEHESLSPGYEAAGGGRYDNLVAWAAERAIATERMRGGPTPADNPFTRCPAIGMSFFIERTAFLLKDRLALKNPVESVFVKAENPSLADRAVECAASLRDKGLKVVYQLADETSDGALQALLRLDSKGDLEAHVIGPDIDVRIAADQLAGELRRFLERRKSR